MPSYRRYFFAPICSPNS